MSYINLPKPAGGGGGGGTPSGSAGSIQVSDGTDFSSDHQFKWDTTNHKFNLNGLAITALSATLSLSNNVNSPSTLITFDPNAYRRVIIEYSVTRGTDEQVGQLMVVVDTTLANAKLVDEKVVSNETGDLGITFSAAVLGGIVNIQYVSTNTGFNGFMQFSSRQW